MGMSPGNPGAKRGRAAPEMNVTPLVDVVLVLLIIFMVITPLLAKQLWLALPDRPEQTPPPGPTPAPLVLTVTRDGSLKIQREVVAEDALESRLRRMLAASRERTVVFDAHDDAPFGRAGRAIDLARGAGATTIVVATERLPED